MEVPVPILILMLANFIYVNCCNEAVCRSIVSKCLLTKSCSCDLKTRLCSKDCFSCLGHLYTECCSCVGMCPVISESTNALGSKSHVEDFPEAAPQLFSVLTEVPDELDRYNITTYPVEVGVTTRKIINLKKKKIKLKSKPDNEDIVTLNCTVVFWAECMSWSKCKGNCLAMGSSSYRWFHDGCCECVGQHCVNYGINVSSCSSCPYSEKIEESDDYDLDYDENEEYDDVDV